MTTFKWCYLFFSSELPKALSAILSFLFMLHHISLLSRGKVDGYKGECTSKTLITFKHKLEYSNKTHSRRFSFCPVTNTKNFSNGTPGGTSLAAANYLKTHKFCTHPLALSFWQFLALAGSLVGPLVYWWNWVSPFCLPSDSTAQCPIYGRICTHLFKLIKPPTGYCLSITFSLKSIDTCVCVCACEGLRVEFALFCFLLLRTSFLFHFCFRIPKPPIHSWKTVDNILQKYWHPPPSILPKMHFIVVLIEAFNKMHYLESFTLYRPG